MKFNIHKARIVALIGLIVLVACKAPTTPTDPGAYRIAFLSSRDPQFSADGSRPDLYLIDRDGKNLTRLTTRGARLYYTFSPDGLKIAFSSVRNYNTAEMPSDIYIMNTDGSNQTRLTDTTQSSGDPAFSPDGAKIVFESGGEIRIINVDGSGQTTLVSAQPRIFSESWPRFFPDGSKIMYLVSTKFSFYGSDIFTIDIDGTNQTRLTTDAQIGEDEAQISHDGSNIIFASDKDGNVEIYIMDTQGNNQTHLSRNSASDRACKFFPDGSKILFISTRDGGDGEVYLMGVDGSNQKRLTNMPGYKDYLDISSDGAYAVFTTWDLENDRSDIYIMDTDGNNITNLTNSPYYDGYPLFQPRP